MTAFKRLFISFFLSTGAVAAEEASISARQALINMNNAMQVLNYQGTVAFFKNNKLETMKYFHAVKNGHEQERLLSLNSPLREVVRDTGRVACRFNDNRPLVVNQRPYEHSFIIDMPINLDKLAGIYHFELDGEEDIAMLPSYVIGIKPNDQFRYDRKVWVEKQKFLPLKAAIYDFSGTTLEQIVFIEQEVKDQLALVDFQLTGIDLSSQSGNQTQSLPPNQSAIVLTQLPPGFETVFFTRGPMHDPNQLVDHLVLSDGFAFVSVYKENANSALPTGLQTAGAVHSFSRILDNFLITVMGEVPAMTVQMIAEGVKLKDSDHQ